MPTVADEVIQGLKEAGVSRVFGLPGGEIVHALDAIRRSGLPFVLARHETAAAFMAEATARLTGRPGACLTTLGPGAANALTGVAHAYLDRAPVAIITGQMAESLRPDHSHQYLDLPALFAPLTKASVALKPKYASREVARVLRLALTGRPGPVHLQLARDDAMQPVAQEQRTAQERTVELHPPEHPLSMVETAARTLRGANRPVILAGLGLEPERPYAEFLALAQACHAPVIVTPKAKGAISDQHPLSAGVLGLTHNDPAYEILDEADCVVAVGFDPVELVRPWDHAAPLIWICNWSNHDPALPAAAEFVGPMRPTLRWLGELSAPVEESWGERRVARHRQALAQGSASTPVPGRMRPIDVLRALRETLPEGTVVTADVGSHKILACLEWPAFRPNRFLVSNGLSSMGYGLPAAIAASLALPEVPAVCLTGDAGLAMVMGELGTLAELGTTVLVIVFNDGMMDLIRLHQRRAGLPSFGTEFKNPDFSALAEAHGIEGVQVSDADACAQAATRALVEQRPLLIEALIDPASYPRPLQ